MMGFNISNTYLNSLRHTCFSLLHDARKDTAGIDAETAGGEETVGLGIGANA